MAVEPPYAGRERSERDGSEAARFEKATRGEPQVAQEGQRPSLEGGTWPFNRM